jgi:hypothetical protein
VGGPQRDHVVVVVDEQVVDPLPGPVRDAAARGQPHPVERIPGEAGEQVELLLGGQPADVPDQQPPVGGEPVPQLHGAVHGVELLEVDPAWPERRGVDPEVGELPEAGRRGGERAVDALVDAAGEVGHRPLPSRDVVALGETDQVGLVDRHGGDAELLGGADRLVAEGGG